MKTKEFNVQYKDEGSGSVEGYASTWIRQRDSYGDVVAEGAFTKTLKERWNGGKGIPFLWAHQMDNLKSIIGTAEDFSKFAVALANGGLAANGHRILSPESVSRMHRVEVSVQDINRKFSCIQGKDYSYGLGVRTRIVPTEWGLGVGEFGWDGAAGSYLMVDPDRHISLVIGLHLRDWWRIFKERHLAITEQVYRELN